MFKATAGRIQLDINSLLVNIYTDRYVGNEGIYIVLHTILVIFTVISLLFQFLIYEQLSKIRRFSDIYTDSD